LEHAGRTVYTHRIFGGYPSPITHHLKKSEFCRLLIGGSEQDRQQSIDEVVQFVLLLADKFQQGLLQTLATSLLAGDDMQLKHDHQLHQAQQMSIDLASKLLALFRYQICEQPLLINTFTHCFIALEKWSTNYCYIKTHLLTERREPLLLNTCLVKHQPLATLKSSPPL